MHTHLLFACCLDVPPTTLMFQLDVTPDRANLNSHNIFCVSFEHNIVRLYKRVIELRLRSTKGQYITLDRQNSFWTFHCPASHINLPSSHAHKSFHMLPCLGGRTLRNTKQCKYPANCYFAKMPASVSYKWSDVCDN